MRALPRGPATFDTRNSQLLFKPILVIRKSTICINQNSRSTFEHMNIYVYICGTTRISADLYRWMMVNSIRLYVGYKKRLLSLFLPCQLVS